MSDATGFVIENSIYKSYKGPNVEVLEIPEGVTEIAEFALRQSNLKGCKKIIFPKSLSVVGNYALNFGGDDVEELEFLGDVKTIGVSAFENVGYSNKKGIQRLTFHGKVGEIKERVFPTSKITSLEFPMGIDSIGIGAFRRCEKLERVYAPGIKKIGNEAFSECEVLKELVISEKATIGEEAFAECKALAKDGAVVVNGVLSYLEKGAEIPDGVHTIDRIVLRTRTKLPASVRTIHQQRYAEYAVLPEGLLLTDEKLGGKGLIDIIKYKHKLTLQESAAIYLFQSGKQFDELIAKMINQNVPTMASEMVTLLETKGKAKNFMKAVEYVMNHAAEIPGETVRKLYDIGISCKYKKEAPMLERYLPSDKQEAAPQTDDICAPWREMFNEYMLDKSLKPLGLKDLSQIPLADGSGNAPEFLVKCAIVPYLDMFEGKPKHISNYTRDYTNTSINEQADRAAALLDKAALGNLLKGVNFLRVPQAMLAFCRYASGAQISDLQSLMRTWADWYGYGANGRCGIIVARGALMLSDSREAMVYIEKCGLLSVYAKLRGTDADTIRDAVLANFGLDASGKKVYNLGEKTVIASLASNLTLSLWDVQANKVVKSLPKKGSDPQLLADASADLSDMKKNLKKVVKSRNDMLFKDFLTGQGRAAASWKGSYLNNPVLNMVARLLVWSQGKDSFILTENGPVDCYGQPYTIQDSKKVCVAHPIEMSAETVKAWQQFICKNAIVQPFEQMWEPARDPKSVSEDRYVGSEVSVFRFMRNEKHGIYFYDEDFHNDIGFSLDQCDIGFERTDWHRHEIGKDETFTLGKFSFSKYTRQVNHLVYLLDKWTISGRILKDDVSVGELLDGFTMAQISEFVTMAMENGCTNVTAILLDYKNRSFNDFDPMVEFSLDL